MQSFARTSLWVGAFLSSSAFSLFGQSVISAHSGVLHFSEGDVFVDGKAIDNTKFGTFPNIKESGELRTEQGRAEVLLNPGVFLRVAENTSFRMVSTRLIDTRVEFVSGKAMVEVDDPLKENSVTIVYKDYNVQLKKHGIYEFQSDPAQLKVFSGEAAVESGGNTAIVKDGRLLPFTVAMAAEKFDAKDGDELFRWSKRRSEYVSYANVSAAKSLMDSGAGWQSGSWYLNPYYGMYTYIPGSGTLYSPFGYSFWSPYTVYSFIRPASYFYSAGGYNRGLGYGGGGYNTVGRTNTGLSRAAVSSASSGGFSRASAGPVSAGPAGGASAGAAPSHVSAGGGGHAGGSRR